MDMEEGGSVCKVSIRFSLFLNWSRKFYEILLISILELSLFPSTWVRSILTLF